MLRNTYSLAVQMIDFVLEFMSEAAIPLDCCFAIASAYGNVRIDSYSVRMKDNDRDSMMVKVVAGRMNSLTGRRCGIAVTCAETLQLRCVRQ
jgi:hypothetical protein